MWRFYWLLFIFTLSFSLTNAQDKVIEHSIQKGETVYGISKTYGVSMEAIFVLNPGSREVIYTGEILRVPENGKTQNTPNTNPGASNGSKYVVVRGDTKSGLSRKFGISIASLEQQNPQIVPMLMAGHVLSISKDFQAQINSKNGEHFVNKGETLWGIARDNGISVNALIAANQDRLDGVLKAGQTLRIPEKNSAFSTGGDYIVKTGDTKWGLSKRFNLSIAQLEAKNPQIVPMLMAGHRLTLNADTEAPIETTPQVSEVNETETAPVAKNEPEAIETTIPEIDTSLISDTDNASEENTSLPNIAAEENASETEVSLPSEAEEIKNIDNNIEAFTETQNPDGASTAIYKDYVIQAKETLYGLSKKAGMSMEAFVALNPQLSNGVAKGAVIKMPTNPGVFDNQDNESSTIVTSEIIRTNPNETLFRRLDKDKRTALYFGLQFALEDYENGSLAEKVSDDATLQKHIDFYQGAEMAIDSARGLGLNFDVSFVERSASGKFSRLKVDNTSEENAVIVPFLKDRETYPKVISKSPTAIIGLSSNSINSDSNTVYDALPSQLELKTRTLNYIAEKNAQIIVVSDLDEARNKDLILNIIPDAQFLKVDKTGFFVNNDLTAALHKEKLNYVILDTDRTIVFLNATTEFMGKLSEYDIEMVLIESASLPKPGQVSDMRFRILKLIFPSVMPIEKDEIVLQFEQAYKSKYDTEASENAILGFDTTFDVLLRLSQSAGFENSAETLKSQQLLLKFDYEKSNDTIFENKGLYLLQYGNGNQVIEID